MGYGPIKNGVQGVITPREGSWASVVNEKGFMHRNTFVHTAAALVVYDQGTQARCAAWDKVETNADAIAAEKADIAALKLVQEAFYEDTKSINSLDNCYRIDLQFMRRMARGD